MADPFCFVSDKEREYDSRLKSKILLLKWTNIITIVNLPYKIMKNTL